MEHEVQQQPWEEYFRRVNSAQLIQQLGPLYECSEWKEGIRVRTPFTFPCGQIIDVFCKFNECGATITDNGDTLGWLSLQSEEPVRSQDRLMRLIREINKTSSVKLKDEMLYTHHDREKSLAEEFVQMLQTMIAISNLYYTLPHIESQLTEE